MNFKNVIQGQTEDNLISTERLLQIILTRIPIHLASIEKLQLVPLKNGKNNYEEIMENI